MLDHLTDFESDPEDTSNTGPGMHASAYRFYTNVGSIMCSTPCNQPQALARSWIQNKSVRMQITLVSILIVNICIL